MASNRLNPHFAESVRLLVRLHKAMASGDDEEADAIRDQMDKPWRHLGAREISRIGDLSADHYTIGEQRTVNGDIPSEVHHEFAQASERGDWEKLLELVRQHRDFVAPSQAAAARGMAWARLGVLEGAIPFFEEALRLSPGDRMCEMIYLTGLIEANHISQAVDTADEIVRNTSDPALLLKAAEVYFVWASTLQATEAESAHRRAIELAKQGLDKAEAAQSDSLVEQLTFYMYLHLSLSHKQLGEQQLAIEACHSALAVKPGDSLALVLMEDLTDAAENGVISGAFSIKAHRAIALSSTETPPPIVLSEVS